MASLSISHVWDILLEACAEARRAAVCVGMPARRYRICSALLTTRSASFSGPEKIRAIRHP